VQGRFKRVLELFQFSRAPAPEIDEDLDLDWLYPPKNSADVAGWDRYWSEQFAHGLGPVIFDMVCNDHKLVTTMNHEGMTRILCAGNGISQEPQALAAAGFEVVALDISPRAMELAQSIRLDPQRLNHFFEPEMLRPGGQVDFVVGDIRNSEICSGPFDVVIERCTAQLYSASGVNTILDKLAERLDPNGILISHCHDGAWKPPAERRHFNRSWFQENGWTIWTGDPLNKPAGRVACLSVSTG